MFFLDSIVLSFFCDQKMFGAIVSLAPDVAQVFELSPLIMLFPFLLQPVPWLGVKCSKDPEHKK